MAERRSHSSDPYNRRRREVQEAVHVDSLQAFAAELASSTRQVAPWTRDLRGNALSINSYGHRHHPVNLHRSLLRWAWLVESFLESQHYGIRATLAPRLSVNVFRRLPRPEAMSASMQSEEDEEEKQTETDEEKQFRRIPLWDVEKKTEWLGRP